MIVAMMFLPIFLMDIHPFRKTFFNASGIATNFKGFMPKAG